MNIFWHELRSNRKSTIIWSCSLALLAIFFLSLFPSFAHNAEVIKDLLAGYPETLRKAVGISIDNIATIPGFYAYFFLYILLCGGIQAMNLGTSAISKEMREKTADFLLTKPVSRTKILSMKLLATLTSLIITNIVYLTVAIVMAQAVSSGFDMKNFILTSLSLFFVQLIFLTIGVLFAVNFPKIKSVIAVSLSTVFSFFVINAFAATTEEKGLRYFTPFQYFDPKYINKNGSYESIFLIIEFVFIIVAVIASYWIYRKKDIDTV